MGKYNAFINLMRIMDDIIMKSDNDEDIICTYDAQQVLLAKERRKHSKLVSKKSNKK